VSIDRLAAPRPGSAFRHEAFLYGRRDQLLAGAVAFVRHGLAEGESVLVTLSGDKVAMIRAELGRDSHRVYFTDIDEAARNPARLIPHVRDFVDEHGGGDKGLRCLSEPIVAGCHGAQLVERQRQEALVNLAFASVPSLWLLCPYDVSGLDPSVVDEARRTHPHLLEDGVHRASARFPGPGPRPGPGPGHSHGHGQRHGPAALDGQLVVDTPLPDPPDRAVTMEFDLERLRSLRAFVAMHAMEAGLDMDRTADLVLAVNELGANSVVHASGHGTLRLWRDGGLLVCQVDDDGHITDPLVGLQVPCSYDDASRGLWVVNQLCDLVQMRSSANGGTSVRVHMELRPVSTT
jgi:anti-sigma regulatory factor (Ser/Thr protein kinase)